MLEIFFTSMKYLIFDLYYNLFSKEIKFMEFLLLVTTTPMSIHSTTPLIASSKYFHLKINLLKTILDIKLIKLFD